MKTAIYALTSQGFELAMRLGGELGATVFALKRLKKFKAQRFESLTEHIASVFNSFDGHIFISAAGIAVRCIAPHLKSKSSDPAVVVLDQEGKFAISLLSGHLGGANELAKRCAEIMGGVPVLTTATDSAGLPSIDMIAQQHGMTIGNIEKVKTINAALLDGQKIQIYDPENLLKLKKYDLFKPVQGSWTWKLGAPGVWVSWKNDCIDKSALKLYPKVLMLGVGCRKGTINEEIRYLIGTVFRENCFAFESIGGLASVDLKADEEGLLEAAASLGVTPVFYDRERLDTVQAPNPSGAVMRRVGVGSVAEASALLLSDGGELLVEKTKTQTVTLAVARKRQRK